MSTLIYTPGVRIVIDTIHEGPVDVSDDIVRGQVRRVTDGVSSATIALRNPHRKYDRLFTPNDRVSIALKRVKWLQQLTGYVNAVPYVSVTPRTVNLSFSCSLKRAQYHFWDPGSQAAVELVNQKSDDRDGGLSYKAVKVLTDVVGWDRDKIHIGRIPEKWFERSDALYSLIERRHRLDESILNGSATFPPGAGNGTTSIQGIGPGTGELPYTSGKTTWFGGPAGGAYGAMALTGESGIAPRDPWYAAIRAPFYAWGALGSPRGSPLYRRHLSPTQEAAARRWWTNRKLIVTNPANGRQVVVRVADLGPAPWTGNSIDLSKHALTEVLGAAGHGVVTQIAFAPENAPLGPVTGGGLRPSTSLVDKPPEDAIRAANGVTFRGKDGLKAHVAAAREFIISQWGSPPGGIGGYGARPNNPSSDHPKGLALDIMASKRGGTMPTTEGRDLVNSVVRFFLSNPNLFRITYIIWQKKINSGNGWRPYDHRAGSSITLDHDDHAHISFEVGPFNSPGSPGSPWPGSDMQGFGGFSAGPSGQFDLSAGGLGDALVNAYTWDRMDVSTESMALVGRRALLNDEPVMPYIEMLFGSSMRRFCSAPNGDIVAWFPDYFGHYNTAGKLRISDVELEDFTVDWDDRALRTHVYVSGTYGNNLAYGQSPVQPIDVARRAQTMGIATVEDPELLRELLLLPIGDKSGWGDPQAILQRFGARPDSTDMGLITGGRAEFYFALHRFRLNWTQQFTTTIPTTFLPEAYPGMLVVLEGHGFQAYVESVVHTFDFRDGGGFDTAITVTAPSALDGSGLFGLVKGS